MSWFKNLKIAQKLGFGFTLMGIFMLSMLFVSIEKSEEVSSISNKVNHLRVPIARASLEMLNGINHSLAALRGWMILGKDKFKTERAKAWSSEIEPALASMTKFFLKTGPALKTLNVLKSSKPSLKISSNTKRKLKIFPDPKKTYPPPKYY